MSEAEQSALLWAAFEQIDAANGNDPNTEQDEAGNDQPKELLYARRMTAELARFAPQASEALQLAARAQHIRRWEIPRKDFPMDRAGYHQWRTTLYKFHADRAAEILEGVGYDAETIDRVRHLIQKKSLRSDEGTQTLEDVICLVFLQYYFLDFAKEHPEEKVIDILQKTWKKMSNAGHEAALQLDLPVEAKRLISLALS